MKTTCRFMKNNGLFSVNVRRPKNNQRTIHQKQNFSKCKNTYNHSLSRARVRTHHRSFCFYAVTSVTAPILIRYISNHYRITQTYFNKQIANPTQTRSMKPRKPSLSCLHFPLFRSPIFPICDTCDSKKSKSLLEGALACARTRGRKANIIPIYQLYLSK